MARGANTRVALNVSGMADVKAALDRLSKRMGKGALERAGVEAAEPMARLMRQLAPKDTTELAESIDVGTRATNYDAGWKAYSSVMKAGGGRDLAVATMRDVRREQKGDTYATVYVGPHSGRTRQETIKGYAQEFGTATMEPNSYIRAGWDQGKDDLLRRLKENIAFEVFSAVEKAQRLGRLKG